MCDLGVVDLEWNVIKKYPFETDGLMDNFLVRVQVLLWNHVGFWGLTLFTYLHFLWIVFLKFPFDIDGYWRII